MGRRDRAAPNNLPRTSHSRLPPYLHDCNASLFLLGDTEHCCVNSPISLASHASFKSPSSPPTPAAFFTPSTLSFVSMNTLI